MSLSLKQQAIKMNFLAAVQVRRLKTLINNYNPVKNCSVVLSIIFVYFHKKDFVILCLFKNSSMCASLNCIYFQRAMQLTTVIVLVKNGVFLHVGSVSQTSNFQG